MINYDENLKGKKLLILGGTSASLDLVKLAQSLGIYVIVTDEADTSQRESKKIADEVAMISTNDFVGLEKLIKDNKIDGVFCGPSEFNLKNLIHLCDKVGLPCYATPTQWDICSNKKTFKDYCKKNNIPTAEEYSIDCFNEPEKDKRVNYPVIVKPVDGCSSNGISICNNRLDVLEAYEYASTVSVCKKVIIEQYIDNGGSIFSFRYILDDGKYYPYLTFDTYIADPINKKSLISAFTIFPSNHTNIFLKDLDKNVQNMFKDMGLENGVAFIQAIPYKGKIYCHEMGYRLSGGMIYKITEPLMQINDMKMMLRFSLGEKITNDKELARINLKQNKMVVSQLMIPLESGTIKSIDGLNEILKIPNIIDFLQYYYKGDTVKAEAVGTLSQHFGRFTIQSKSKEEAINIVRIIQQKLVIKDLKDEDMYRMKFDTNRIS